MILENNFIQKRIEIGMIFILQINGNEMMNKNLFHKKTRHKTGF